MTPKFHYMVHLPHLMLRVSLGNGKIFSITCIMNPFLQTWSPGEHLVHENGGKKFILQASCQNRIL